MAIIGYDPIQWVTYLDAHIRARQLGEPEPSLMDDGRRKTHFVQYLDNDEDELRRSFYQALLKIKWLPSKIRSVVMSELGLSLQKQKRGYEEGRTIALRYLINERKVQMRANGERPHAGIHDAAVADVADRQGMSAEALKQRITRLRKRPRK